MNRSLSGLLRGKIDYYIIANLLLPIFGIYIAVVNTFGVGGFVKAIFALLILAILAYAFIFQKIIQQIQAILLSCFVGIEYTLFLLPIFILINVFTGKENLFFKTKNPLLITLIYLYMGISLFLLFVYSLVDGAWYNSLLWLLISFGTFLCFVYFYQQKYTEAETTHIFQYFEHLIWLQIPILFLQLPIHRSFNPLKSNDMWKGSFDDGEKLTFFFVAYLLSYYLPPIISRHYRFRNLFKLKSLFFLFLSLVLLVYVDAKLKLGLFFITIIIVLFYAFLQYYLVNNKWLSGIKILVVNVLMFISIFGASIGLELYIQTTSGVSTAKFIDFYLNPQSDSKSAVRPLKIVLYQRVYYYMYLEDLPVWAIGAGPGRFGSKAANIMATDVLYKEKGQLTLPNFISPYSSYYVKKYMGDIWTAENAMLMTWMSANFTFPFAGWITIKSELGIGGLVIFILILFLFATTLFSRINTFLQSPFLQKWALSLAVLWFALPTLMFFDNIQDQPQYMIPLMTLSALLLNLRK
ncbi:MAG: hypothetical protein EAZ55_06325 [Cytophagales bacterium]|nr:MAG: hypothetical protein EAZ55_06325 [Cytophagales bacterium]